MRIANKTLLDDFVQSHAQSAGPLNKWVEKVKGAKWTSHADLKQMFPSHNPWQRKMAKKGRSHVCGCYIFSVASV